MNQHNIDLSTKTAWETPAVITLAISATAAGEKMYEAEERQTDELGTKTYAPSVW